MRSIIGLLDAALEEGEVMALARRPLREIKTRIKRLTSMVQKCIARKPKLNGYSSSAPAPFTPPSDDPDYDALWEERMWSWLQNPDEYESWYEVWGAKDKGSDLDLTELFAPSSRERTKRRQELESRFEKMRRDIKSWKTRRRLKWRIPGNPSIVLS